MAGDVARDPVETQIGRHLIKAVAEQGARVAEPIAASVAPGEVHGNEVLVDHQRLSLGRQDGKGDTDGTVAATQSRQSAGRADLDLLEQQAGSLVDRPRGKQPPGALEAQRPAGDLGCEVDGIAQAVHLFLG